MPPGQLTLNEFEAAIFRRLAEDYAVPALAEVNPHVLARKFTGVGSFTDFFPCAALPMLADGSMSLRAVISVPGVPTGLSATLFVKSGYPKCLEIYAFGEESWNGSTAGFRIASA